jgi:hypothetical protein
MLSFGPFALPLIWWHPDYKRSTKTIWTIGITTLSIVTAWIIWALFKELMKYLPDLMQRIEVLRLL